MTRRLLVTLALLTLPRLALAQTEDVRYFHSDAIGSVRLVTDANGQVVERYDYLPFGEPWTASPTGTETRRFGGKERDAETGLDYFGARYYASGNGRFTTVDPGHVNGDIFDPQSWNGYAYARNNPLKYTDPTGTEYEICAYGASGYGGSCGTVSDQYFAILSRNPGAGIRLWGGAIFSGNKVVGYYNQTSVDPTFGDFVRLTGALSSRWLREQSTEMAIGAAIAATGGLASGVLGGGLAATSTLGLEAPSMTEIANATASGARMANLSVNLTAGEFQANLVRSGYKVVRQGVGSNGPFTVLSKGEKTYTIYTASSTGGASAQVRVAGQTVSKIRLSGF
jgi:RHS repeat-associated protein